MKNGAIADYITKKASTILTQLTNEEAIDRDPQIFENWSAYKYMR